MDAKTLNDLRDKAHAMAREKGWHDEEHSDEHWLMLVITEVAEAVEAYRERGFDAWFECPHCGREFNRLASVCCRRYIESWKPCGVGSELADVVIRVMDFGERYALPLAWAIMEKIEYNKGRPHKHGKEF